MNNKMTLNVLRTQNGLVRSIYITYDNKALMLTNNTVNATGIVRARKGFHPIQVPIGLSGPKTTCVAGMPTNLTILRSWITENVLRGTYNVLRDVTIILEQDAVEGDIEELITNESKKMRDLIRFKIDYKEGIYA